MKGEVVVSLEKGWWKKDREPANKAVYVQQKRKIADKLYSIQDLTKRFNCGYDLVYKAIRRGDLDAEPIGRSWRVSEQAVENWIALNRARKKVS